MDDAEFAARRRALSGQTVSLLTTTYGALGSWRDADVTTYLDQAVPTIQAGQQTLGELTAVYMAAQLGPEADVPALASDALTALRRGVTPDEVYTRPFVTTRTALAQGKTLDEAVHAGQVRAGQIAEMDLQQTYAHAAQAAMYALRGPRKRRRGDSASWPRFWARVPQGSETCAFCLIASTQRYHLGTLNPLHPACDCIVKPLAATQDPGQVIAPELLEQAHAAAEEMTGTSDRGARSPDYRKIMTQMTGHHGELGALLHDPGDHFTGPAGLQ